MKAQSEQKGDCQAVKQECYESEKKKERRKNKHNYPADEKPKKAPWQKEKKKTQLDTTANEKRSKQGSHCL